MSMEKTDNFRTYPDVCRQFPGHQMQNAESETQQILREMREHFAAVSAALTSRDVDLKSIQQDIEFLRGYTQAANENVAAISEHLKTYATNHQESALVIAGRLAALEAKLSEPLRAMLRKSTWSKQSD